METNRELLEITSKLKNVHLVDFSSLQSLFDPRFYYLAKIPFGRDGLRELAVLLARSVQAALGKRKKCLVLDLDNLLWGGTLAEDGIEHLKLSNDGEGKAFYDFQNLILELYQSGTILAVCSKNDEQRALKAINELPYMVLREDKFAAIRINWLDKAQNIRSIAKELNIGLDSLVFLDDSKFERSSVKKLIPEVTVPEMPEDFSLYPTFLAGLPYFDTFALTEEDASRGELYVHERKRQELKAKATSFDDFLRSLHMKVKFKQVDPMTVPRIAQLTQKTNQFNLSLTRYQEADIVNMQKEKNVAVYYASSSDDLGDAGIVGVAIIKKTGNEVLLDTFLMSCRVLGRGIEDALFCKVCEEARAHKVKTLMAKYNSTEKNAMVRDFLLRVGFTQQGDVFLYSLANRHKLPPWIKME